MRGGPSPCVNLSKRGVSSVRLCIPHESMAEEGLLRDTLRRAKNQMEYLGRDKNRRAQTYSLTCKLGHQGQGQPCSRQPSIPSPL